MIRVYFEMFFSLLYFSGSTPTLYAATELPAIFPCWRVSHPLLAEAKNSTQADTCIVITKGAQEESIFGSAIRRTQGKM